MELRTQLRIWQALFIFPLILVAVFLIRVATRQGQPPVGFDPKNPGVVYWQKGTCTGANYTYHTACTDGWWEHWWDGIQYCGDARATCELHGGTFKLD
jgi:hypothetical protein